MSIFQDFFAIKQKPIFTGSRYGFGSGAGGGGAAGQPLPFSASGGTVDTTSRSGKTIRTFNSSGSFTIQGAVGNIEILVVGGGGAVSRGIWWRWRWRNRHLSQRTSHGG